ncbi:MAG: DUF1178 family protein [Syntrophales bacterium]|nr:DUF1178 family protein [Syntrophales bacterium]MDY0043866.1 DUF1178 family protein [Syntrophales bacterium]
MIIYDLACQDGHKFEGWFKDRASFEEQKKKRLIICPACGSYDIDMIPSSVSIVGKGTQEIDTKHHSESSFISLKMLNDFIDKNFDNVGDRFAEVALKMHKGEEQKRNIKGVTTKAEEETLKEEGVQFIKVPSPKFNS